MRCILIANARRKHSQMRGAGWERVDIGPMQLAEPIVDGSSPSLGHCQGERGTS